MMNNNNNNNNNHHHSNNRQNTAASIETDNHDGDGSKKAGAAATPASLPKATATATNPTEATAQATTKTTATTTVTPMFPTAPQDANNRNATTQQAKDSIQQQYLQGYVHGMRQAYQNMRMPDPSFNPAANPHFAAANSRLATLKEEASGTVALLPSGLPTLLELASAVPGVTLPSPSNYNNNPTVPPPAAGAAASFLTPFTAPTGLPNPMTIAQLTAPQLAALFPNTRDSAAAGLLLSQAWTGQMPQGTRISTITTTNHNNNSLAPPPYPAMSIEDGYPIRLPAIIAQPDDHMKLNSAQCVFRQQIEVYEASHDDCTIHTRGRNKRILPGQIGIRCRHCSHLAILQRQKGSNYFPNSINGLYQASLNMNVTHLRDGLCTEMPDTVKIQFALSLAAAKHQSAGGKTFWLETARRLGLVDTEDHGIRFRRNIPPDAKVVETREVPPYRRSKNCSSE